MMVGSSTRSPQRLVTSLACAFGALALLWYGFFFLRDTELPRLLVALIAIAGFGAAVSVLFLATDVILRHLPPGLRRSSPRSRRARCRPPPPTT